MSPIFYILIGLALIGILAFLFWNKIAPWVNDSETLFFARLQMLAGAILGILAVTDLTPIFTLIGLPKWAAAWPAITGVLTEVLRRSRATDL